jgi:micrococcal nuclease
MRVVLAAVLLALAPALLQAATFRGTVTHVTDGDTLWVRPAAGGAPVPLRLLHVDAPEGCQPYGAESGQALRSRLLHRKVRVRTEGADSYQRQLAHVEHRGQDVGAWLVRHGYAWSTGFHGQAGPYADLQAQARREGSGLWAVPGPVEPRSFRRRFGRCH